MEDPLFDPWGDVPEPGSAEGASAGKGAGRPSRWRLVPDELTRKGRPAPRPLPGMAPATTDSDPDASPPTVPAAVLDAVADVVARVRQAGHEVRFDDRKDLLPPSVRLQIVPWVGPMDPPHDRTHPVLELVESESGSEIVIRTWLRPDASEPSAERTIPVEAAGARIHRVLIDFVETVLKT